MYTLAGDIGGTKSHLALYEGMRCIREEKFPSREFKTLTDIILRFCTEKVERACLGIAGPVKNQVCKATNLPWIVDAKEIEKKCSISKVFLLNDLEALAWSVEMLKKDDLFVIHPGQEVSGNRAVIAAGTGLGEAGLFWEGERYHPFPSEGGHADFGPRDEKEIELWRFLKERYGHVSYERILSGPGLENLYLFLKGESLPAPDITQKGLKGEDEVCREVLRWFLSLYASEAGNLALKYFATGGVYLGGGIIPRLLPLVDKELFLTSFCAKGRFNKLLAQIPIRVILKESAPLEGATAYLQHTKL